MYNINIQQNERSYKETFWKTNEQRNKVKNSNITAKEALKFGIEAWVLRKKRGTTFRSSTDEIFETLTWNYKIR